MESFDIILTVIVLSFWFLFPVGMFVSVSHVDKNTDQIVRLGQHRHYSTPPEEESIRPKARPRKRPSWRPHGSYSKNRLARQ